MLHAVLAVLLFASYPAAALDLAGDDDTATDARADRRNVPAIRQVASIDTQGNAGTQVLKLRFPQPTLAGSTIYAWSRSAVDGQTLNLATFTDDRGNLYIPTGDMQTDVDGRVNGAQGTAYAPNIAAGTQEITATWIPFGDYRTVIVAEITGVSEAPLLGSASSIVFATAAGVDNISSGRIRINRRNALMVAICSNEWQIDPASTAPYVPHAGTGMTSWGTFVNYGGKDNYTRLAWRLTGRVGFKEALFSSTAADEHFTFMAVFR